jgi:hypothetical protein
MSVMSRCFGLSAAGLVGVVAAVALIAVPAAWADNDTINAQATVQFSGAVDNPASCTAATSATIDWGDGTTPTAGTITHNGSQIIVSGTHMYAETAVGTNDGTVTLIGGNGSGTTCGPSPGTQDDFTANVSPAPPMFTECPPVDANNGCQFLITVGDNGETVVQDPNQGPYEGADDALIGVYNNSSSPIFELPLSVPNSDLFGFDGDGVCDPGSAPLVSGCIPTSQSPAGQTCDGGQDEGCAFPTPTGTNAPPPGYTPTGYEGPTTWFSSISPDTSSGVVNFSPPLQPGQSTYFSLEEPPTGSNIGVGGTAAYIPGAVPPTVTSSTGASFSGTVYPNGTSTTAYFQYGLVLGSRGPGQPTTTFYQTTPVQAVGSDFSAHVVTASVTGLVPNAVYNVELVATNSGGTTYGPNESFTTLKDPPPPPPVLGKSVNVSLVSGHVFIEPPPGKSLGTAGDSAALSKGTGFVPLTEARQIPTGSEIDALHGSLKIVSNSGKVGKTQTATLAGSVFKVTQARSGISKGLTNFNLVESAFQGAPSFNLCKAKKAGDATAASLSSETLELLKVSGHGKFRTTGRYSSATVRGTAYTVADKCDGTLTHVLRDTVTVDDFVRHTTILLHAGQSYLAKKP